MNQQRDFILRTFGFCSRCLNRLADKGNTVLVIEHNMDVIKVADYIFDLGPEGGERGGNIVCEGTPGEMMKNKKSITAEYLRKELENSLELGNLEKTNRTEINLQFFKMEGTGKRQVS